MITKAEILKPISQYGKSKEYVHLLLALNDKLDGKMTQEELSSQCYLWTYHYVLHEYEYKPLPITPFFMMEFYRQSKGARRKVLKSVDEKAGQVRGHLKRVYRIQAENRVHKNWLEEMLEYFEKENKQDKVLRIKGVLDGYT